MPGQPVELVIPTGMSERAVDRALRAHAPWIARQLATETPPALELPEMTEQHGRRVARALVTETAGLEAPRIGVTFSRVAIRDTRTRWGSCSSSGSLSFSWRLALAPRRVLDYVVVHELCHLVHHDHSKRFWSLLERVRPDFREQRDWLDDHGWELLAYRPRREPLGDV
jgi:predicted metal-dependent hydrolase